VKNISRLRVYRFNQLALKKQNIGHLLIEAGLNSLNLKLSVRVIKLWDKNIGTSKCSCQKKGVRSEILLASTAISHESLFVNHSEFKGFNEIFEHLIEHHDIRAVLNLGINGLKNEIVLFEKLSTSQKNFLLHLKVRNIPIGCRGRETMEFLQRSEFKVENLYLTGCPSLQLIKEPSKNFPLTFSRVLVTGALATRLDLLESKASIDTKLLFIPQTVESYLKGLEISKTDQRIEVFLPATYNAWIRKIKEWKPEIALGTRLHGNMAALSLGIPAMFMSGDIRTREITQLANLPFADDLLEIGPVLDHMTGHYDLNPGGISAELASQIRLCLREFIDRT
jgi:hypothetical protein